MSVLGYVSMTRPVRTILAGGAAGTAYLICGGTDLLIPILLFAAVACIYGGGNVFNDCFDADDDRIIHPTRPIPAGNAQTAGGWIFSILLFFIGFCCSLPLFPWCPWLAAINILMLIMYSTSFKRMPILRDISVAYLAGSVFLFGGMAVGVEAFFVMGPIACMTFLSVLAHELLSDAEHMPKDSAMGTYTLPMIIGIKPSMILMAICLMLAVLTSYLPALLWGFAYALAITAVDVLLIWAGIRTFSCTTSEEIAVSKASLILKIGMVLAILVFVATALAAQIF